VRTSVGLAITSILVVISLLVACSPASPTAIPTKPSAQAASTVASSAPTTAPAAPTVPPVAATKPAVAAPTAAPTAIPGATVKRGGTLRHARWITYPAFDAHLVSVSPLPGLRAIYDAPLFAQFNEKTKAMEIKPELFESWTNPDPKTVLFKIRKGVKFHDGSMLDGEVARFNIDRMVKHPKSTAKVYLKDIKNVERVDDTTVKVELSAPSASLLAMLTGFASPIGIVSKAAVDKLGDDEFNRKPVGSGPFQFGTWISDDRLTVQRFDGYWRNGVDGKPLPYLDSIVFRFIPDASVSLVELRAGNIEVMDNIDPKDAATVKSDAKLALMEIPWAGNVYFTGGTNAISGPFANNLKLRQALHHAIDRESMAKVLTFGMGTAHLYPYWAPGVPGFDASVKSYPYDQTKAKQLLAEAGFPNGMDIDLAIIARPAEQRMAEIAKQMFDQVGFRTKIDAAEVLAWRANMKSGKFSAGFWRGEIPLDPDQNSRAIYSNGPANWAGFNDPSLDKCMDEGTATLDPAKRAEVYKRCLTILQENAYLFSGYFLAENWAGQKTVRGVQFQGTMMDLREAWLDK
jgi:peptide/nickel transport system substrate-binding protein